MRGSPLFRTLAVAIALIACGWSLRALTTRPEAPVASPPAENPRPEEAGRPVPFFLTLSHPAHSVSLESAAANQQLSPDSQQLAGSIALQAEHDAIFLRIEWQDEAPAPRFAKLVIEPAERSSLTRTFDATGTLEDVWEIHLSE